MTAMIIANSIGVFLFFFLLWKTLKDDYHYEKIFNLSFILLGCAIVLWLISGYVEESYRFIFIFFGSFIVFTFGLIKQKMNFYESFEGFVISFLAWYAVFTLQITISQSSLSSFLSFWMTLISIFIFYVSKTYYRSFSWYKSGKVGFAGIVSLIFFILSKVPFYWGTNAIYLLISASLLLVLVLYNLSRKVN